MVTQLGSQSVLSAGRTAQVGAPPATSKLNHECTSTSSSCIAHTAPSPFAHMQLFGCYRPSAALSAGQQAQRRRAAVWPAHPQPAGLQLTQSRHHCLLSREAATVHSLLVQCLNSACTVLPPGGHRVHTVHTSACTLLVQCLYSACTVPPPSGHSYAKTAAGRPPCVDKGKHQGVWWSALPCGKGAEFV